MNYYFNKKFAGIEFDEGIEMVTEELKKEGFGILTEVDVKATFKKKLDIDFRKYKILGACNPPSAFKALNAEHTIGLMLPCNVVVEEDEDGYISISAINPLATMQAADNKELIEVAKHISGKLKKVIDAL
ncbi:MAG: DUF302 domain-containing protein [Chlorobi bacterium]|nr:DUF302 domain-containing protein [Chlorobiota bacterium]